MKQSKHAALVILAAGLGTRFKGGIKQLSQVGPSGELLIEYSIYDALKSGFDKVVFIIREELENEVRKNIGDKISNYCQVEYAYQKITDIPNDIQIPAERTKPWGTVHALLSAKEAINVPFVIINADDYYGSEAFSDLYSYITSEERCSSEIAMSGFILENTLSSNGTVTRGVCQTNENNELISVEETYHISSSEGIVSGEKNGSVIKLCGKSIVSMNMWACQPSILPMLEQKFENYIHGLNTDELMISEYALPVALNELLKANSISIKVLPNNAKWYGITVMEDLDEIRTVFADLSEKGRYPTKLF